MSWLNPSPGSARASSGPSWLTPSPGGSAAGSKRKAGGSGQTNVQHSSASQPLPDWLNPPAGSASVQGPSATRRRPPKQEQPDWLQPPAAHEPNRGSSAKRRRTSEPQPDWCNPPPGAEASCSNDGSQRSEFSNVGTSSNKRARHIHLDLVSLLMINSKVEKQTCFQTNGADAVRIRNRLSQGCKCGAMAKLRPADVIAFCGHLHSLDTDAVTHYFHTAYDTCDGGHDSGVQSSEKALRTEWHFLGHRMNVECLQQLLGMSHQTFYKKCHGALDLRKFPVPSGRATPQSLIVDQFFCELYCSAAERLPEVEAPLRDVDSHIESHQSACEAQEPLQFLNWTPHQQAMDVAGLAVSGMRLPVRHLQHCRLSDLWWQFVAWHASCEAIEGEFPCPSWSTFWRRWDARWRHALGFRSCSQHSQCKFCFQCSAFLHKGSGTPEDKRRCAQEWREHMTGQYHDRLIYWHMRWFSRLRTRGVLCIIIDSMDKAKLPFPQYQWRKPKCLDRLRRPRIVITCAWAHGFCCDFYAGHDELQPHGASAFCEVLTRTIQHVMDICRRDNIQPPEHLVVQSDNTTSQAKNSETGMFLATVVGRKKMLSAILNFLIVGHTHEDIDQLFSVLLALVVRRHRFHTPQELVLEIQIAMDKVFADRPEEVSVHMLGEIFDFGSWLLAEGVHLHNCWVSREGVDAPHSFCYKMREDLTASESAQVLQRRAPHPAHDEDVFCVTKRWMHSEQACPPVLVLPVPRLHLLESPGPVVQKLPTVQMDDPRKKQLQDLATHLENMTEDWGTEFSYFRAAQALRDLAAERVPPPVVHTWLWDADPPRHGPLQRTQNRYFNNIPNMAWSMLARFRRLAAA